MLTIGVLVLAGFLVGLSGTRVRSGWNGEETAQLDVDGVTYRFAPTTCTITDTDFLAAGGGSVDGEPFWISASSDRVNLTVGQESEVDRPDNDQLWLMSVAKVSWQATDDGITGSAVMRDERDRNARSFRGSLSIECPSA